MKEYSDESLDRLFAAARSSALDTANLEEHFETRLMARIRERHEHRNGWFLSIWRMIPVFAVLTVLIAVCSITFEETQPDDLFAAITTNHDDLMARSFFSGE